MRDEGIAALLAVIPYLSSLISELVVRDAVVRGFDAVDEELARLVVVNPAVSRLGAPDRAGNRAIAGDCAYATVLRCHAARREIGPAQVALQVVLERLLLAIGARQVSRVLGRELIDCIADDIQR